jgi:hypothetical protein
MSSIITKLSPVFCISLTIFIYFLLFGLSTLSPVYLAVANFHPYFYFVIYVVCKRKVWYYTKHNNTSIYSNELN